MLGIKMHARMETETMALNKKKDWADVAPDSSGAKEKNEIERKEKKGRMNNEAELKQLNNGSRLFTGQPLHLVARWAN